MKKATNITNTHSNYVVLGPCGPYRIRSCLQQSGVF